MLAVHGSGLVHQPAPGELTRILDHHVRGPDVAAHEALEDGRMREKRLVDINPKLCSSN